MGKNQSASNLPNIIKQDANGSIAFMHGNTMLMQVSSSGAITTTGVISGSNALSASYAASSTSASYAASSTSASYSINATSSSYAVVATTASFADALTVAGTLTAQTLVVQTITSSVDFVTGSTRFGSVSENTHVFTGSMSVIGSQLFDGVGATFKRTGVLTGQNWNLGIDNNGLSFYDNTNTAYRLTIASGGNIGIGTTNPSFGKLSILSNDDTTLSSTLWGTSTGAGVVAAVYNTSATTNSVAGIRLITRNSGASVWNIYNVSTGNDTGDLAFGNGAGGAGTEKIRITNGGNVGIGTTSPSYLLDVNGNARVTNLYAVNDRNNFSRGSIRLTSATNNASTLDITVTDSTTNIYSNYYSGGNDNTLILGTYANYTNQLVLKSNGRIGIGTTNPQFTLDVNGGIRTTGLAILNNYSATYTTDSSWTSFQTVIPGNTLNAYETYLVELNWTYSPPTYAPYYASAAFLFRPVSTNATSNNNSIALQTSCHIGGDYIISVAQKNVSGGGCGGLVAKLSWETASPSYITVTAKRIAIP